LRQKTLAIRRKASSGSALALLLFDEETTQAAIKLSWPEIESEAQAAALFANIQRRVLAQPRVSLGATFPAVAATFITNDWFAAQLQVRRLLPRIARYEALEEEARAQLRGYMNEGLVQEGEVTLQVGASGLAIRLQADSIMGAASRGLMPFLVPNGWPVSRLGQCRLKDCARYFLRPGLQRGRRAVFCRPEHGYITHTREFDERQRELRSRRSAARKK
jgi:hypothetical protein